MEQRGVIDMEFESTKFCLKYLTESSKCWNGTNCKRLEPSSNPRYEFNKYSKLFQYEVMVIGPMVNPLSLILLLEVFSNTNQLVSLTFCQYNLREESRFGELESYYVSFLFYGRSGKGKW